MQKETKWRGSFSYWFSANQTLVSNLSRILFSAGGGGGGGDTIDWDGKQADNFLRRLRMKRQLDKGNVHSYYCKLVETYH